MSRWNNKAGNLKAKHFWANLKLVASPMFTGHNWTVMRTCHADKIVKKAINVSCAHGSCGGSAAILLIGSSSNEAGAADHWIRRWRLRRRNFDTSHITKGRNIKTFFFTFGQKGSLSQSKKSSSENTKGFLTNFDHIWPLLTIFWPFFWPFFDHIWHYWPFFDHFSPKRGGPGPSQKYSFFYASPNTPNTGCFF